MSEGVGKGKDDGEKEEKLTGLSEFGQLLDCSDLLRALGRRQPCRLLLELGLLLDVEARPLGNAVIVL